MRELTLVVVGIDHPNADKVRSSRRMELLLSPPGEPVELRLEPKNPHDPHAVSVWSRRGVQTGYLSAERAPWIGARLRAGEPYEAVFQGLAGPVGHIRIRFGGGAPTLPPACGDAVAGDAPARPGEADFYPDEDGSIWGA